MTVLSKARPRSAYRAVTDGGREFGVQPTSDDRRRLAQLARWYALTAEHLARLEVSPADWFPHVTGATDEPLAAAYSTRVTAIKKRLAKLARVEENVGNHTGPLVGSSPSFVNQTAWYCTRYGISVANLPWRFRSSINPQFAAHAFMAADIGTQIEAFGHIVYSERELTTRIDRHGGEITAPVESWYTAVSGVRTAKKPDVAVLAADGRHFIAIEVERDQNRPLATYQEKLRAYDDNANISAVWYLCASPATVNRVGAAADRVFGDRDYPLRILHVGSDSGGTGAGDGWAGVVGLEQYSSLSHDLDTLLG